MSFPMDSYCMQCYLKRNIDLVRPLGPEEKTPAFAKEIMKLFLAAPEGATAPWFGPQVAQLLNEMYGLDIDRFHDEKAASNRFVLERLEEIRRRVQQAPDPILAGLQYAILGNYLDFSALQGQVSFEAFTQMLDTAQDMRFDIRIFERFCRDLQDGEKLLYLTDNAGEIGFDRIFAETMVKTYPHLDITFCVRGGPTLNDATREDAETVGIPFRVIDNGNLIPGTQLDELGAEARQALCEADVILAKGMANVETMLGCGYNIYYAFLVKCQRFVNLFGKPLMTPMLVEEQKES